jgi:putative hydrolase of the HAD superfamily
VACRFVPRRRLAALERLSGLPAAEIHARIWGSGLEAACERGEHSTDEAARRIAAALGCPIDLNALGETWALAFEPDPAVLAVVDKTRAQVPTGLLTNNGPLLLHALPDALPEVARRFDPLLFSCAHRALKPSAKLYSRVLLAVGRPADQVLLIDDAEENVKGARAAGLQALHYRDPATLRHELSSVLD